jgi:hypothetical protein
MKTLLASLAVLAGTATLATAETYFTTLSDVQGRDGIMELGTISSDSDGVLEIYSYQGGEKGPMLGWEALSAGANSDVRVPVNSTPFTTALAEIVVDGQVVSSQRIRIED